MADSDERDAVGNGKDKDRIDQLRHQMSSWDRLLQIYSK